MCSFVFNYLDNCVSMDSNRSPGRSNRDLAARKGRIASMSRRRLVSPILVGSLLASLIGAAPETPTTPPAAVPGVERIEVRLAQIDVVVRDRDGKIVSGLGPADFAVFEDGSPLVIDAVDEWGRPPAPVDARLPDTVAPPPTKDAPTTSSDAAAGNVDSAAPAREAERRSFIIVFDALGDSTALRMSQAKRAATQFVKTRFKDGDIGAIYQLDLSLRPVSGVTSDREELAKSISRVAWMPASSLADQISESVLAYANQSNVGVAEERLSQQSTNVTEELDWQREHTYDRLTDVATIFQALPGKRVLVLASPGFPMTTPGDLKLQKGGFTPKFQRLIKTLATFGVTVYSLDIGSDLTMGDAGAAIDWRVAAGKLGMDENVLGDLGLDRTMGTAGASSRRQFLGVVAAESGGRMLTDTDLSRAFAAVDEESRQFYRISVRLPLTRDLNRYRGMKVVVQHAGYKVSGRRGRYSDVTPLARSTSSASLTSVESVDRYRPIATRGAAVALPALPDGKIPVAVVLEALGPVEVAEDPQGAGSIDLEVRIVARAAGEIVARYDRSWTAKVRRGGIDPVRHAFRVEGRMDMIPGIYEFQGTVRLAAPAQLGTWTGVVHVAPQSRGAKPSVVGPIIATERDADSPLLSSAPVAETSDSLAVKTGVRILPTTSIDFAAGDPLLAMFWLKDFPAAEGRPPELELSVRVVDATGAEKPVPSQLLLFAVDPQGGYRAVVRVETGPLEAGAYSLRITVAPGGSTPPPPSIERSVAFTLHAVASPAPHGPVTSSGR